MNSDVSVDMEYAISKAIDGGHRLQPELHAS